ESLDLEALRGQEVERLAGEVVGGEPDGERLEDMFEKPNGKQWAADVLEQEDPAARAQYAASFRDGTVRIRDGAEAERAHDRVEGLVGELECVCVAEAQIDVASELLRTAASYGEHLLAEID